MKTNIVILFSIFLIGLYGCDEMNSSSNNNDFSPDLSTTLDTISYVIGYSTGNGMEQQGVDEINKDVLLGAMNEGLAGEESKIDMKQASMIVREYIMQKREELAEENLEKSEKFLEKNSKKEGVQTTESGLQYKVIEEGTGETPTEDDRVKVDYHGTLQDGTVFDSSKDRGKPATFSVKGVIPGWKEGLQLMKEGSKYQFFVPPSIGYGERGSRNIDPNSVLIFDVELLEVNPEPEQSNKSKEQANDNAEPSNQ